MEAEVGTPIEYNPEEFINKSSNNFDEPDEPDVDEQYINHLHNNLFIIPHHLNRR